MEEIKHLKIETGTYFFLNLRACKETCLTHACLSIFCMHSTWGGGVPDTPESLAWGVGGCAGLDQITGVVGLGFLLLEEAQGS
jgi:hypothetical protein